MTPGEALDAALEVRRGKRKLADFTDEKERKLVTSTLYHTPEWRLADHARRQELGYAKPFSVTRPLTS